MFPPSIYFQVLHLWDAINSSNRSNVTPPQGPFNFAPWFYFCENTGGIATVPGGPVGFFILEIADSAVQVGYFILDIAASSVQVGYFILDIGFFILEIAGYGGSGVFFILEIVGSGGSGGFYFCESVDWIGWVYVWDFYFFLDADSLAEGCNEREDGDLEHNLWLI
jgi:hypothetical protein